VDIHFAYNAKKDIKNSAKNVQQSKDKLFTEISFWIK
jgi:hypothetical protein